MNCANAPWRTQSNHSISRRRKCATDLWRTLAQEEPSHQLHCANRGQFFRTGA